MAYEDGEMENLTSALVALMRRTYMLWSEGEAGPGTDSLAVDCARARAEFEHALATYIGVRRQPGGAARTPEPIPRDPDLAAETSVGDSPLVLPLAEASAAFEQLYSMGALTLFAGDRARAAHALGIDHSKLGDPSGDSGQVSAEIWSTISALAQAGLDRSD